MNKQFRYLAFALIMLGSIPISVAKDVVSSAPNGSINWSNGTITAEGYGAVPVGKENSGYGKILARRAAMVDAYRNLAEIVHGVRVTSGTIVKDMMAESSSVATRVKGLIKGAQVVTQDYDGGIYKVIVEMPIKNRFVGAVYPSNRGNNRDVISQTDFIGSFAEQILSLIPSANAASQIVPHMFIENQNELNFAKRLVNKLSDDQHVIVEVKRAVDLYERSVQFSGLVVDATGVVDFELATVPRLRDENGTIIYPNEDTSYDEVIKKRPVSYDFNVSDAITNKRVSMEPFIVKAIGTYKSLKSDLVVSGEQAEFVKRMNLVGPVKEARVIIVVAE